MKVCLRISAEKTKVMQIYLQGTSDRPSHCCGGQNIDDVDRFTYLGSVLTYDGDAEAEVNCRVGKAASVFQRMRPIWTSSSISSSTKHGCTVQLWYLL